ncbi:MAG: PAS domain S-box protein [Candidatus Omnitrophota bacterium]|jgi:PAS domain S-box-containing protein
MDDSRREPGYVTDLEFRQLAESSGILIWETDSKGRYTYISRQVSVVLGYSPAEIIGNDLSYFLSFGLDEEQAELVSGKFEARKCFDKLEITIRRKDGQQTFLEISAMPRLDEKGGFRGFIGVMKDTTGYRLAENKLRSNQEFIKSIIQNSAVATFVITSEHKVIYWNRACEELTGTKAVDVINTGMHWTAFYKSPRPCVADIIIDGNVGDMSKLYPVQAQSELIEGGLHSEGWYIDLGGKDRYIIFDAAPIYDADGNVVAAIETLHDISESKKAQEELAEAYRQLKVYQSQLIQAAKMDTVGTLASGVAHEVKNPLAVILQGVEYLFHSVPLDHADNRLVLGYISEAVGRADRIIKGLLDFSSLTEMRVEPEQIEGVIDSALLLVKNSLDRKKIKVFKWFAPGLPAAKIDRNKFEQVLVNLLVNAIDAMPEHGEVSIKAYGSTISGANGVTGEAGDGTFEPGSRVAVLEIEDSGPGIPEENLEKVFDPFFTTKRQRGGSGLGLSIVRNIIDMHGGKISVDNRKDARGVRVKIILKT